MGYSLLADLVVAVHVAYVSYVLFGQLAICLGLVLRSGWVRNFWFRSSHLLAIAIVATEAIFNVQCPLTSWEDRLRTLAGQEVTEGSFIGRFLHDLMFFNVEPWVFTIIYIAFAVLVLGTFLLAPPRWPRWRKVSHPSLQGLGGVLTVLGLLTVNDSRADVAANAAPAPAAGKFAVRELRDISYCEGQDADPARHKLDLFLPKDKQNFPVLVLVHGGAWTLGDKSFFGRGSAIGEFFAQQGIGVVLPSYRLAPAVKNTAQVKDVARAVAWTYGHLQALGAAPDQLFLCGHSAGGQLVSLLMTDASYLKAEGLNSSAVKGAVSVSGVYQVPEINLSFARLAYQAGVSLDFNLRFGLFSSVFGDDSKARKNASPLTHVRPGLAPFLIVYADRDLPTLPEGARAFAGALQNADCQVQLLRVEDRDHESVMFRAQTADDPVAVAIEKFIARVVARPAAR